MVDNRILILEIVFFLLFHFVPLLLVSACIFINFDERGRGIKSKLFSNFPCCDLYFRISSCKFGLARQKQHALRYRTTALLTPRYIYFFAPIPIDANSSYRFILGLQKPSVVLIEIVVVEG